MMLGKSTGSGPPFRILPLSDADTRYADDGPAALLRAIATVGLRHKGKLALWVAFCLAAALVYARTTPSTYTAAATVLLEPRRQLPSSARETVAPSSLDLNHTDSELQVIRSERLLTTVFDALALADHGELIPQPSGVRRALTGWMAAGLRDGWKALTIALPFVGGRAAASDSADAAVRLEDDTLADPRRSAFENFARRYSARRIGQSYVLEISYASSDPQLPARVANAAASAYLLQSVAFKADAARSGAEFLQGRLDALASQVAAAAAAVKAGALPVLSIPDADARIIGAAQEPLGPSAPRTGLIMAFAGVAGLLSGVFVAALGSVFDRRVRRPQDLQRETGLSCLAVVPEAGAWRGRRRVSALDGAMLLANENAGAFAEAIRGLRTAMEIGWAAGRTEGSPVVAIGAWKAGVGATLLTMNLAQLLARRGRPVSVFSADLPDPRGGGDPGGRSLADLLVEGAAPEQAAFANFHGVHMLSIRSAASRLNRFVDFRDPRAALIVAQARQHGEVLIDLPPLSESADAIALASHADVVILVAAEGRTSLDELNDALGSLQRAGVSVIGAVINRSRS